MDKTIFMELLHAREFKAVRSILNVMKQEPVITRGLYLTI